jgi:hypothetical protein
MASSNVTADDAQLLHVLACQTNELHVAAVTLQVWTNLIKRIPQTSLEIGRMQIMDKQKPANDLIVDQVLINVLTVGSRFSDYLKNSGQALAIKRKRRFHEFVDQFARRRARQCLDLFKKSLDPPAVRVHGLELLLRIVGAGGPASLSIFDSRQGRLIRGNVHTALDGDESNSFDCTIISFDGLHGSSTIGALKRRDRGRRERVFPIFWPTPIGTVRAGYHCGDTLNFEG